MSSLYLQITSQDKTAQVIQRALEKHNLEEMNCQDFSLTQVLSNDKGELLDSVYDLERRLKLHFKQRYFSIDYL